MTVRRHYPDADHACFIYAPADQDTHKTYKQLGFLTAFLGIYEAHPRFASPPGTHLVLCTRISFLKCDLFPAWASVHFQQLAAGHRSVWGGQPLSHE